MKKFNCLNVTFQHMFELLQKNQQKEWNVKHRKTCSQIARHTNIKLFTMSSFATKYT